MKQIYEYNKEFFAQWLKEHPEITKRDILTVIKNKDYASLRRWAEGDVMPTKTIIRLCNHYGIDIWNFFTGMSPKVNSTEKEDKASTSEDAMSHADSDVEIAKGITRADYYSIRDLYNKERKMREREDAIRAEYEKTIKEKDARIDFLVNQILELKLK